MAEANEKTYSGGLNKLPVWFSLEKYPYSKDIKHWLREIEWRAEFAEELWQNGDELKNSEWLNIFEALLTGTRIEEIDHFNRTQTNLKQKPITNTPWLPINRQLNSDKKSDSKELDFKLGFNIDMRLDEQSLKYAFDIFLKNNRPARDVNPNTSFKTPINNSNFEAWKFFSVLPYFDLTLWAELTNTKLQKTFLESVFWPTDHQRSDRIRNTVDALSSEVISISMVGRLKAQIAFEAYLEKHNLPMSL